jgi:hypothetical protein
MTSQLREFGTTGVPTAWAELEVLEYDSLEPLGKYRARGFATAPDGREVEVGAELAAWELTNPPTKGEVRIQRAVMVPDPLAPSQRPPRREVRLIRGWIREPGTYAKLLAADEATAVAAAERAARASSRHRVDVADLLPQLDRVPERAIGLGGVDGPLAPLSKSARMLTVGGRGPWRGVEAIAEWLRAQGVQLDVTLAGLDVTARRMSPAVREVLDTFGALLAGHISGKPVPCALAHTGEPPPAFSLAVPSLPACREHLEQLEGER